MWRRLAFIRQAKLNLLRMIRIKDRPHLIAGGAAIGMFVGMTPTMGLQMPIALCIAFPLRQSKLAAALLVWVTNPLTAPFIYALEYEVGRWILGLERLRFPTELTLASLTSLGWQVLVPLWIGGLLFAVIATPPTYLITLRLAPLMRNWRIRRWPRPRRSGSHRRSDRNGTSP